MRQVYVVKTRKKIIISINMTIIACRVNNNDATMIPFLMADTVIIRLLWGHTPGNNAYNNQLT
jgi:hypothetical protein